MPPPARFCTTKTQNGPRRVNKERMEARCEFVDQRSGSAHYTTIRNMRKYPWPLFRRSE
jgi:hypothetical protein